MIKCVIFDADGTLIDSLGIWREADEEYLRSVGRRLDENAYRKFTAMTYAQSIAYVKQHYGLPMSEKEISDGIMKIVMDKYTNNVKPVPGVQTMLERLLENGIPMAVATANDRKLVCRALRATGMRRYFSHIVTCDECGCGKENAGIFIHTAELMRCDPGEAMVVEDDRTYVRAAREAGFIAIHISEIGRLGFGS